MTTVILWCSQSLGEHQPLPLQKNVLDKKRVGFFLNQYITRLFGLLDMQVNLAQNQEISCVFLVEIQIPYTARRFPDMYFFSFYFSETAVITVKFTAKKSAV